MTDTDLDAILGKLPHCRRTKLLNPADRECSPEVYADPVAAELANDLETVLAEVAALRAERDRLDLENSELRAAVAAVDYGPERLETP